MPKPFAICIENLKTGTYLGCVALVGDKPGLTLNNDGIPQWEQTGCVDIFVTADNRLGLLYNNGPTVKVTRNTRTVEAQAGKPIIILDKDKLTINKTELQIHIHGEALQVHPPTLLDIPKPSKISHFKKAAVMALGMLSIGCKDKEKIEIVPHPPQVAIDNEKDQKNQEEGKIKPDTSSPNIEVIPHPPRVAMPKEITLDEPPQKPPEPTIPEAKPPKSE